MPSFHISVFYGLCTRHLPNILHRCGTEQASIACACCSQATLKASGAMATTQPRIFTFSKGGGSKGDKSMKELVSGPCCCAVLLLV
jgi:hypothetical protein